MLEWLETCHPDVRLVQAYWDGKRAGRLMPSRADIDPGDIRRLLPHIILVDVVADARRFVYRLVGTKQAELRGRDPTGKSVAEGYFAATAEDSLINYETVVRSRAPLYVVDPYQALDRYRSEQDLFLPLSDDGETVNKILVFSVSYDLFQMRGKRWE